MRFKHIFLFVLLVIISSCQKKSSKELTSESAHTPNFEVKTVSPEDVPRVIDYLRTELENEATRSLKGYGLNLPFSQDRIIEERINQVEDPESGVITYAFAIDKVADESWLYNLVITENPDGSFKQISLMRYDFPEWFNEMYNSGDVTMVDFKGSVKQYSIYSENSEEKGIYDLEPCRNYDNGDPVDGRDDIDCGCNGGIAWSNTSVGNTSYSCSWETITIVAEQSDGSVQVLNVINFLYCVPEGDNFTGFDHCPDPDPIAPNDDLSPPDAGLSAAEIRDLQINSIISESGISDNEFRLQLSGDEELRNSLFEILRTDEPDAVKAQQIYGLLFSLYLSSKKDEYDTTIALLKRAKADNVEPYASMSLVGLVTKAAWLVIGEDVHIALDVADMIPVLGEPADLVNAVIYTLEGDGVNATISVVALWPFGGQVATGTRLAFKAVKTATGRTAKLVFNRVDGVIDFCNNSKSGGIVDCRGQLARMFSYNSSLQRAHHMVPWGMRDNAMVQRAAEAGLFHPNMKANGKVLDKAVHNGSHPGYDAVLREHFRKEMLSDPSPEDAANIIFEGIESISTQLDNGVDINSIVLD